MTQDDYDRFALEDELWDVLDEAWETNDDLKRAKLARDILTLNPKVIDAYYLLALSSGNTAERLALLFEATRRGRLQWKDAIKRPRQHDFWLDINTRPFMRALHFLALTLWEMDEREAAISEAKLLLKLNPNDNQGVRFILMTWYPLMGDWESLEKLLRKYGDEYRIYSAYSRWLLNFHMAEPTAKALKRAININPYVPSLLAKLLTGVEMRQDESKSEEFVPAGSQEEAWEYIQFSSELWENTDGAMLAITSAAEAIALD
ncbi:hypothetical protein [Alterisphingorhabdus coralli]|uniref:Tetratricopeptide repeat protein n=1 Tax=Alterisphingorhabdus coralli TaxID=3071408 RepID=A0AA97I2A5_9SPHN|nr:hypothetical protein [Parasphingorhabdus sp. SCSIO 66989]WOE76185.1 hypothetical protein RB602_05590 [Parasphingorhabdus sp. SCSIO 66989]